MDNYGTKCLAFCLIWNDDMKAKSIFICQECGYETGKWLGKCPACNNWNTFVEEIGTPQKDKGGSAPTLGGDAPSNLSDIPVTDDIRVKTGIGELDNVMGGGIVPSSLTLVGGEPGIGKSTLLLQICQTLCGIGNVLYVSGEESAKQLKLRANRLGVSNDNLYILSETNIDSAIMHAEKLNPVALIIDSVQTMYTADVQSAAGSVSQVREITMRLMRFAKSGTTSVFLVGHVTKDGSIAGPRVLEHMVDCVLYFEGERQQSYRILRAVKNRFGSTNEIGVFEMCDKGLLEVLNPSAMLLSERPEGAPGSVVFCAVEGSRPILAEIQALVAPTNFGIPRRMTSGFDLSRLNLLTAVLEKRVGLKLSASDVYVNIIGGLKIDEPAADIAVMAAITSSLRNAAAPGGTVFLGEIGLTGELRSISDVPKRVSECTKMGFKEIVIPSANAKSAKEIKDVKIHPVKTIREALAFLIT